MISQKTPKQFLNEGISTTLEENKRCLQKLAIGISESKSTWNQAYHQVNYSEEMLLKKQGGLVHERN